MRQRRRRARTQVGQAVELGVSADDQEAEEARVERARHPERDQRALHEHTDSSRFALIVLVCAPLAEQLFLHCSCTQTPRASHLQAQVYKLCLR